MTAIGIIRCQKNESACPLTGCLKALNENAQGFAGYEGSLRLVGVFTCRCPGDQLPALARILKNKGADAIHFPTCTLARKEDGAWLTGQGLCPEIEALAEQAAARAGIPCVLGSAHLPEGYAPRIIR